MKKTLSIASLLAMILSVAIFTSCSEPEPYTGKFYNTEYVTNISDAEYNENWVSASYEEKLAYIATWSEKSGYEKKTNLKDYEVSSYMQSKMDISDKEVQEDLLGLENEGWKYCAYNITGGSLGNNHNILFLTIAE
ncbi:MAG: hypothetical protein J5978_07005 [Spirochaetaceae bacterium]|nr:hypothetical protein [Spirochaetaceae bacterium]